MAEAQQDMRIGDVTEQALLAWIVDSLPDLDLTGPIVLGIGDDAAVVRPQGDIVLTTDTLVHGPDFRHAWSSAYDVGWKSAAVNLADVAAMGAQPVALLIALTLPADLTLAWVREFYTGMVDACAELAGDRRVQVVGGDVTVSATLTIAVTAVGDLQGRPAVTRSGASIGDVVALAGTQGYAVQGLAMLFRDYRDADKQPVALDRAALTEDEIFALDRQLRPVPPLAAGPAAALAGATAMMDVSDGLLMDARRMARSSGVGFDIARASLGVHSDEVLHGGEDHSLLATFPAGVALPGGFRLIGTVTSDSGVVSVDGVPADERGGWDPYQDWDASLG